MEAESLGDSGNACYLQHLASPLQSWAGGGQEKLWQATNFEKEGLLVPKGKKWFCKSTTFPTPTAPSMSQHDNARRKLVLIPY